MSSPDLTEKNRAIVEEFARLFYGERRVREAFESFVTENYIQHNPGFADGREAAIAGLTGLFGAQGASFDVQRIAVDGDLAAVHLRGAPADHPPVAVADFYRLADGKIVEHWDVLQPIPDTATNDHPMF